MKYKTQMSINKMITLIKAMKNQKKTKMKKMMKKIMMISKVAVSLQLSQRTMLLNKWHSEKEEALK